MTLEQLRARLAAIHGEAQAIQTKADAAGRPLSAAEESEIEKLFAEFDDIDAERQRRERLERNDERLSQPQPRKAPSLMHTPNQSSEFSPRPIARPDFGASRRASTFAQALEPLRGQTHGFDGLGQFMAAVANAAQGRPDNRLRGMPAMTANEGVGAEGGFLIPPAFTVELLESATISAQILSRVRMIPMPNGAMTVAGFGNSTHAGGAYGGLTIKWAGEESSLTPQTPSVRQLNLKAKKATLLVKVTNELLQDAPGTDAELGDVMMGALASGLEGVVLNGSGAGKPQGLIEAASTIEVAKVSGQTADTLVFQNFASMMARMHPGHLGRSVWVASQTVFAQLLETWFPVRDDTNGTVGGERVFMPTESGDGYTLLGRPLFVSEHCQELGDSGDLILTDLNEYALGMVPQLGIQVSQHVYFDQDSTAFRLVARVDGMSRWASPITPAVGSTTVSPAVKLAERA